MKTVGIVAEYNPFHNGHAYHIQKAKEMTGADCAVVVMNGNFMQRGLPAFVDKYTRTKMALAGGADMVFELPVCFGLSSAEDFAFGSVALLNKLGFIDAICFGSEIGNIDDLLPFARLFIEEPEEYRDMLTTLLREGYGFPAAREQAAMKFLQMPEGNLLSMPNNLLGIEYIKALLRLSSDIKPFTISRMGAGYHDNAVSGKTEFSSATGIRGEYLKGNASILQTSIPKECRRFLEEALTHYRPLSPNDFSESLYYALREHIGELDRFKDVSEDLADRMENLLADFRTTEQFASLLHTKQYTKSRIDRCLFQILLGIGKQAPENIPPLPLRLLGLNPAFSFLLKGRDDIITKPAKAKEALTTDFFATDLYNYTIFKTSGYVIKQDFYHSPIVAPKD